MKCRPQQTSATAKANNTHKNTQGNNKYLSMRDSPPISRRKPLPDAPIEQPPGLSLNCTSRCQIAPDIHRLWPTLVNQSWTAGGREAKIYQQRQQPARHSPRRSVWTAPRSGTSPRLSIEHAGTALKANIPLRMSLCNNLQKCGTNFSLANDHQALVRTESGPSRSATLSVAGR